MIRKIISCIGEYKKYAILTPVIIIGEVLMEIMIPFVMAKILDVGINGDGGIPYIIKMGIVMLLMAAFSLICGSACRKIRGNGGYGICKKCPVKSFFNKIQVFL